MTPQAERSEVEALARKVSAATNVPLFAPRTFAELFRHLVEEIAEKGYHFQSTAENVAARMAAAGRNVTRRQVVFVVKGLALKGHVFSTADNPERLADVFREQVLYLAENAGLQLDDREKTILSLWIVGRAPAAGAAQETEIEPDESATGNTVESTAKTPAKATEEPASRNARKKQGKVTVTAKPEPVAATPTPMATPPAKPIVTSAPEQPKPAAEAKPAAPSPAKPAEEAKPAVPPPRPVITVKPAVAAPAAKPATPPARPLITPSKPATPSVPSPSSARPAVLMSGAAIARPSPITAPRVPPSSKPAPAPAASDADKETVESSILAAIAQAVDVLVEDSGAKPKAAAGPPPESPPEKKVAPEEPSPPPSAQAIEEEEEIPEGDDIGDEIQRIIASYSRNRKDEERR
jgi:hypothetical protein